MEIMVPKRALLLVGFIVVVVSSAGLSMIYLPKADISLRPIHEERTVEQQIILSAQAKEPDFVKFILPVKIVENKARVEQVVKRGEGQEKAGLARGEVRLINERDEEQNLLPKSHLRHVESGGFFLTDKPAKIPPRGELMMSVTAKEPGAAGNVSAGKFVIDKLPTSVQQIVFAESSTLFSGGIMVEEMLAEAEWNKVRETALQAAKEKAAAELWTKAGGAFIRDDLISFTDERVETSVSPGSQASSYQVMAEATARSAVVDENDLLSLTLLELREAAGPEEEFINYNPQSFQVYFARTDFDRGEIIVKGKLTGTFAKKIPSTAFSNRMLAGLSLKEAQAALKNVPGVGGAEIKLSPFWVTSVPGRPEAIEIVVESK